MRIPRPKIKKPKISFGKRQKISIKKIASDPKIHREGVERYIEKIKGNEPIKPITLIKHPVEDLYAVLDGHHRFYAYAETGAEEVDAIVIKSPVSLLFRGTRSGWFQPTPRVTKYFREPMKVLVRYMRSFMGSPRVMLKKTRERIKIGRSIFKKKEIAQEKKTEELKHEPED
jgi:hypothetical protein